MMDANVVVNDKSLLEEPKAQLMTVYTYQTKLKKGWNYVWYFKKDVNAPDPEGFRYFITIDVVDIVSVEYTADNGLLCEVYATITEM